MLVCRQLHLVTYISRDLCNIFSRGLVIFVWGEWQQTEIGLHLWFVGDFFLSNNKIAWLKDRTPDIGVRVICGGKLDTSTASVENSCFIMSIVLPLTKNNEISCAFLVPFYLKKWWVQANQVVERGWTPRKSKVVYQAGVHLKLI